ncbi:MAG: hypothetical protein WBA13_09520 [Microcoleaceae cyanobacterium]
MSLSNSFFLLSNPLKADAQVTCSSENTKIDFETSSYWISIQCQAGKLSYHSSDKESKKSVRIPATYHHQTQTYTAQYHLTTYSINFLSLNIYQQGNVLVEEPVLNIYTHSETSDLDFFNPNRKVSYNPLHINSHENYLIDIYQLNS